jgi:hypothetical protein
MKKTAEYLARKAAAQRRYWQRKQPMTNAPACSPAVSTARNAVYRALKAGRLTKEPCLFCDSPDVQAHHHDYSKPRDVTWLCRRHHKLVHRVPKVPA